MTRISNMRTLGVRIATGAIAAAVALTGMPATAATVKNPEFVRRALAESAECLLDAQPANARDFLSVYPGSKEAAGRAKRMSSIECVVSASGPFDLVYSPEILRGALFKAFYIRDFGNAAPALIATSPDFRSEVAGGDSEAARDYVVMRQFAECVVRKDPESARALVLAPVEGPEESSAFGSLQEDLSPCLVQGGSAQITKSAFTGLIAETLFRLSAANYSASGS